MSSLMNYTPEERAELQLPHLIALAEKVCVLLTQNSEACRFRDAVQGPGLASKGPVPHKTPCLVGRLSAPCSP